MPLADNASPSDSPAFDGGIHGNTRLDVLRFDLA